MPRITLPPNLHPTNRRKKPKAERSYPKTMLGPPYKGVLLAIDPGWTTGIASRVGGELFTCVVSYRDPKLVLDMIPSANQVVVERFTTEGVLGAPGLDTIELVGAVYGFCYARSIPVEIAMPGSRYSHMQAAIQMEGKGPNYLIKHNATSKHEIDALAHLLAYEYRHRKLLAL